MTRASYFHVGAIINRPVPVPGLVASGGGDLIVAITYTVDEVGPDWVRTRTYGPNGIENDYWGNHHLAEGALRNLFDNGQVKLRPWPKRAHSAARIITSLTVHHGIPGWIHVPTRTALPSGYPDNCIILNLPRTCDPVQARKYAATVREYQPYRDVTVRLGGMIGLQIIISPRKDTT
jgi:hypothetical protein